MSNKQERPPVSKVALALGGTAIGAGLLSLMTYSHIQTSNQMSQISEELNALAYAIESSSQEHGAGNGGAASSEDLTTAIEQVMEKRESKEREERRAEMLSAYAELPSEVPTPGDWIYGDVDARYTLYTYADPNCPHCQAFHDTPKQLVDTSRGVLNAQYHHMAIMAANSTTQALASECAGRLGDNQHFWAMLDFVYEHPQEQRRGLLDAAETLGFERGEFSQCMDSSEVQAHIDERGREAQSEGVTGTPTSFLIDNQTGDSVRLSGAQPPGAIVQALQQMIQEQQARRSAEEE